MKLTNTQLQNFIDRIKLRQENMPRYRDQVNNLREKLKSKIKEDTRIGVKVTKFLLAGSWKKRTILRPTGDYPIDVDLVLYVEGDEALKDDLKRLHDFVVEYLEEIYPTKDIKRDVDAEGNTKSIKIMFSGTGLELDIVPVVPVTLPKDYVWQPQRGGGGNKYITSVTKQLDFAMERKVENPSIASIIRAIKWWRNYKEFKPINGNPGLSSYSIELIIAYLDITKGVQQNIEEAIIRFFQFISTSDFPIITFDDAIRSVPTFSTPVYIADSTNNENNSAKKITDPVWDEIVQEAADAFDTLNIAQSKNFEGETIEEWKSVFGPSFNINANL